MVSRQACWSRNQGKCASRHGAVHTWLKSPAGSIDRSGSRSSSESLGGPAVDAAAPWPLAAAEHKQAKGVRQRSPAVGSFAACSPAAGSTPRLIAHKQRMHCDIRATPRGSSRLGRTAVGANCLCESLVYNLENRQREGARLAASGLGGCTRERGPSGRERHIDSAEERRRQLCWSFLRSP